MNAARQPRAVRNIRRAATGERASNKQRSRAIMSHKVGQIVLQTK
jgi:hypothetical protein